MKRFYLLLFILFWGIQQANAQAIQPINSQTFQFNPSIERLRELALVIPGELPTQINVEKVAETIRPANVVIKGDSSGQMMTLARTVYQIQYPNGTIMLDSGMDLATHNTFGKDKVNKDPYFPERFDKVQTALLESNLIIFTHYHADHVAGVIRSKHFDNLAKKTWVTESTAELLITKPHKETTKIQPSQVEKFIIAKDNEYMPIAHGVALFMAPGHTPDSKMLYIRLANGREYIHSVDSGWSMGNITKEKMKNASWVSENEAQLLQQYRWLNTLKQTEKDIIILCTHDNEQYNLFTQNGLLGNGLKISQ